jgi:predicted XRE-type DNA-binding protein
MLQIVVSLTSDGSIRINYDRIIFIKQATVVSVLTHVYQSRLKQEKVLVLLKLA